jgi:16S rRNA (guanine966-N2)-methyltransferase
VRPTPDRVKVSLFAMLGERLANARVLDIFAGTGALGFEALSRGAANVTFVERHRPTAAAIAALARDFGVDDRVTVVPVAVERALTTLRGPFDVIFADPPYAAGFPVAALRELRERQLAAPGATIVCEHSSRSAAPDVAGLRLERAERYGEVAIAIYRADA